MRAWPFTWASSSSSRHRSSASCLDLWLLSFMSGRPEHLDPPGGSDPHVDGVQVRKRIRRGGRLALGSEGHRVAGTVEQSLPAVPPQLAWEVRTDRGDRGNRVAAAEDKGAHAAGRDARSLAFDEV